MSTSLSTVIDEPQVLTGHTDVICSTSIERIITVRNSHDSDTWQNIKNNDCLPT